MAVKVVPHEFRRDVFIVYYEDDPWKEVHRAIFGKSPRVDFVEKDERAFYELEWKLARNFSLRRLAKKNYSSFELETLLRDRLVSDTTIQKLIEEFQADGYINDEDWLGSFVRAQMRRKCGPRAIVMKLKSKGVPEERITEALRTEEEGFPQGERIRALLETKYSARDLSNFKERQKVIAALMRKGFDFEAIQQEMQE